MRWWHARARPCPAHERDTDKVVRHRADTMFQDL